MWETRFQTPDYVFGKAPARFLPDHADYLTPGLSALSVADGEGRNSVYLARQGLTVTALEFAPSAIAKARALAREHDVEVDLHKADVIADPFPVKGPFDITLGIFIQFVGPKERAALFDKMAQTTAPGGLLMLHGYTPKQLDYGTGGPRALENLYTPDLLAGAFSGWEILENRPHERDLDEGKGHSGRSALIDFIARKPL
ncbi:SAM-dependent methyltransferase [Rhodalgimonas zhirmunskyi]|uniref:Class I SAM-dependent methyltransferase n=1 Tax=Rhodalgimonas zhirmunskyi TaxID=2964767 RepID=A0AAJ1U7R5_9RHOB|nr:class I SAM-dependent methyltransferase [Rhodoalgimonas zhirmunskyi]MDQ2092638.1 class I SAM-dependent methyltransferase [Rhodoalgimonas zhirmunskyi]